MLKILITGITGFLGSHIAEKLIQNNVRVIGLKRAGSDTWRCKEYEKRIKWIDIDRDGKWRELVVESEPSAIIHSAWIGVEANVRDNWSYQIKNLTFLVDLLEIGKKINLNKFIVLGSQAEYGLCAGRVSETHPTVALNAYGGIKLASLEILKTFSIANNIDWIWLRIFSIFGEKENVNWLIPSVIQKMRSEAEMDFTPGEQKYAYLYVKDFVEIIDKIVHKDILSGIYNISSNDARSLKSVVESIKETINPSFKLNFGAIAYRTNQSMHIEGDMAKLEEQIGKCEFSDFNKALNSTINYYINNNTH